MDAGPVEGPWNLPAGWRWERLGSLAEFINGAAFKPADWHGEGIPIIRIQNLTNPEKTPNFTRRVLPAKYAVEAGDILLSWSATLDVYEWRGHTAWLNQHIFKIANIRNDIDKRYFRFLLKNEIEALKRSEHLHGSTMMHINRGPFMAHPVPVPPLNTQKKIASRIDALFAEIYEGEVALADARTGVETYRKALLKAAVTGELTADWRAANPPKETGEQLLARILIDRRASGHVSKKSQAGELVAEDDLLELPEGWIWCRNEQAGSIQLGRQRTPKDHDGPHMRPYLRVANVYEDRIDLRDVKQMNFTPAEFQTFELKAGDILLNEGQSLELIGRPAMFRGEVDGCCFQNTLVRFQASSHVDPDFALLTFLYAMHTRRFQRIAKITTNIAHLGAGRFAELGFPLAPLAEQIEAVRLYRIHMRRFEEAISTLSTTNSLRQSILAAAFRGELVA